MRRIVRVGVKYCYVPVPFDRMNPPCAVSPGDIVRVINLPGCPCANIMGMCHVSKDGIFAGMVCTNSLQPLTQSKPKD